jgi:hypothetical protein
MNIVITNLTKQVRFPRSKKRRIRKKWAKRPENHWPDDSMVYVDPISNSVYCGRAMARQIEAIQKQAEKDVGIPDDRLLICSTPRRLGKSYAQKLWDAYAEHSAIQTMPPVLFPRIMPPLPQTAFKWENEHQNTFYEEGAT